MNIRCPHCDFAKDIPEQEIPRETRRVNCPRCGQSFPFNSPESNPSQMVTSLTPTEEAPFVAGETAVSQTAANPFAGFWLRLVAWLIDSLAVTLTQAICGLVFGMTGTLVGAGGGDRSLILIIWMFTTVIGLAYYVVFTGACGQTLGKMALRLKVIRKDGGDIGYGGAFLREVPGKFLSGLILGIGYLMVPFDQRKQGLHDKIAGSYVIKL